MEGVGGDGRAAVLHSSVHVLTGPYLSLSAPVSRYYFACAFKVKMRIPRWCVQLSQSAYD